MMAKDNFDFDTEGKGKFNLDLSFFKNLTQKQKEMILMITIGVIALIVIVVVGVILMTANGGNGGSNGGGNAGGVTGDGGSTENGGSEGGDVEIPDVITDFYLSTLPTKTLYYVGDEANYSGLVFYIKSSETGSIFVSYDDNPEDFTITGFDSSAPVAEQTITVECRGLTDTFTITVIEMEEVGPKLVSIHFGTYPPQIFGVDDKFNYKGGILVCTYSDGSTVEIPLKLSYISGTSNIYDPTNEHILLPGEHTLVVKYNENGVFVQTEYTITVN